MKILDHVQVLETLAKALGKPCIYISLNCGEYDEALAAAPYLNFDEHSQILADGCGIVVCEDDAEMERIYRQTVGDDGPTESNPYDGEGRVYALTCGADGHTRPENT